MRIQEFSNFIIKRWRVFERRSKGLPPPWSEDPILQNYRFCNVRREDDAVTIFIRKNWLEPNYDCEHLWFASLISRFFNYPEFLKEIGFPVPFKPGHLLNKAKAITAEGGKKFNTAYLITTNGARGEKVELLTELVFKPAWARRSEFVYQQGSPLSHYHEKLMTLNGLKSFLAGQVIADLKYAPQFDAAPDWDSFFAIGPGSKRGVNRVFGKPKKETAPDSEFIEMFRAIRAEAEPLIEAAGVPHLHAQDVQNCLCEFDKYERVRLKEDGRVRPFNYLKQDQIL